MFYVHVHFMHAAYQIFTFNSKCARMNNFETVRLVCVPCLMSILCVISLRSSLKLCITSLYNHLSLNSLYLVVSYAGLLHTVIHYLLEHANLVASKTLCMTKINQLRLSVSHSCTLPKCLFFWHLLGEGGLYWVVDELLCCFSIIMASQFLSTDESAKFLKEWIELMYVVKELYRVLGVRWR